jgi:hypothetical protein
MSGPQPRHVRASLLPQWLSPWPDLSGPLIGFQRDLLNMSNPQSRHVQAPPYLRVSQLIQLLTWVPENFPGHDRSPTRTCPAFPSLSMAKSQNRTCPVPLSGSSKVGRTCPAPDLDMFESLTPQRTDFLGGYKRLPRLFNPVGHSIQLANTLRHSFLSSKPLSLKLPSNLSFL